MTHPGHEIVRKFFTALEAGHLPEALLTDDFSAWTTTQGELTHEQYASAIPLLAKLTNGTIHFTVDAISAEDDRVVAEVRGKAKLIDGTDYANTYVFVFRMRDNCIRSVAEHFNVQLVMEKLVPLIAKLQSP
ncbi:nuclear transport factor 2 family protein [Erythrobacter alti]|uniref:nuclear transport factor 2 family protein n=1 Tax=Erythrobacter alti TaxID=1896145 RepID=UPI0030F457B1